MSMLQKISNSSRRTIYANATTVLVDEEPVRGGAVVLADADVRAARRVPPSHPDRESSSQLIRRFILATGLVMPYEPADEALASLDTITSAKPQPLPKVAEAIQETDDDEEPRTWRGTYALDLPEEVIFTKQIDIRPERLEEWLPQAVTSVRRVQDRDE